jgi:anaerobic magnesium-protoporphyrin IX monomethyl ester cyclase
LPPTAKAGGEIVLFSPEHFYVFNTLAVPQLTGHLLQHGYPVVQRVLDNELYRHLADAETLGAAVDELAGRGRELTREQADYLAAAIVLARLPQELGSRSDGPEQVVAGLLERREGAVRLLGKSETLLRERFLNLSKNRFLLALARLQVAVDLCFASFWPSRFSLLDGLEMECGNERSKAVFAAAGDTAANPFHDYYRRTVVPSIPAGAALAGISVTHYAQIIPAFTLARAIREQRPDLHITLGGASVSKLREPLAGDNALTSLYDSFVTGPGEEAVAKLHDALTGSLDLGEVPSLVWRAPDGSMRHNPKSGFTIAQAATPVFTDPRPNPILTIATSSGCDWARCRFCPFPRTFSDESRYCVRSAGDFIRDVRTLTERHQPSYFHICDTNLSVGQLDTLSNALLETGTKARFYSFVRAEKAFTDPGFCRKIGAAGFFALHFGLESGSQEVLDRADKGIDLGEVVTIIDNLHAAGIIVNVFLMAGVPGETPADVEKTVAFTRASLAKIRGEVALSRFFLDPHSDIYYRPGAYGIELREDPEEDLAANVRFHNPAGYNEPEMEALVDEIYAGIGIPRSYGERFFFEMLDLFCPDTLGDRVALYAPFVRGSVKGAARRLVRSG